MPELLSPAGNFEKLKAALLYGADAVYLAGNVFGMRSAADNFTMEELFEASQYTHKKGKKLYLTINTMPREYEYPALRKYLQELSACGVDAIIAGDLGVIETVKKILPDTPLHISTQASVVSSQACRAYYNMGAKRIVLARELSADEIRAIRAETPADLELEAFVHGSMCVSYSGRCLLSNFLTGRDANRGACTQPCRWNYTITEEKRPDIPMPIEQNELGTFILASKDMCTIEYIDKLIDCGIESFKIEGRMKSAYYTAVVTNAYRMALDEYSKAPSRYRYNPEWKRELESVSHREYCSGFYFDDPMKEPNLCQYNGYIRDKAYFATAIESEDMALPLDVPFVTQEGKLYAFVQRNKISKGDSCEIISPLKLGRAFLAKELYGADGKKIESAPHPSMKFWLRVPFEVNAGDIIRAGD